MKTFQMVSSCSVYHLQIFLNVSEKLKSGSWTKTKNL